MKEIVVRLGPRSYKIYIEKDIRGLAGRLKALDLGTVAAIVTNSRLNSMFGKGIAASVSSAGMKPKTVIVPDSEKAKSLKEALSLLRFLSSIDGRGKRLCVIALGGGVVGDLAGFVASIYKRGIPYIQIPTTLLAQVDSSIGGKTAVDLPEAKNMVGSYYQPKMVYINVSFLKNLSDRDFLSGIAEVIKYGIIKDRKLFDYLLKSRQSILSRDLRTLSQIVARSAKIKAEIVSADEREERSLRTILNLGHTVGHAVEAACGYSNLYTHGEAIGIGMIAAARISNRIGPLSQNDLFSIERTVRSFGLPTRIRVLKTDDILQSLAYDKKFIHGITRLVLPVKIGKVIIKEGIPESLIREAVRGLTA